MKLYYSKGACSLAVRIILHEMNIAAEYESVDLKTKKTESGNNFFIINPKGEVPVLVLDNNEVLTENAVIQQYLADTFHADILLPSLSKFSRYRVLEWLNYMSSDVHKGFGALFNSAIPTDLQEKIFRPNIENKLSWINQHLEKNTYLLGDTFTLPDAYLFVMLRWAFHLKFNFEQWPNLLRYFNNLKDRASIKLSLQEEK